MNNAVYLDLLEDALAGLAVDPQGRPAEYELEYLHSAGSGDVLERFAWRSPFGRRDDRPAGRRQDGCAGAPADPVRLGAAVFRLR